MSSLSYISKIDFKWIKDKENILNNLELENDVLYRLQTPDEYIELLSNVKAQCDENSGQLIINKNTTGSWYFTISFYCESLSDNCKLHSDDVCRETIKELLRGSNNSSNLGDKKLVKELYRELDIDNIIDNSDNS